MKAHFLISPLSKSATFKLGVRFVCLELIPFCLLAFFPGRWISLLNCLCWNVYFFWLYGGSITLPKLMGQKTFKKSERTTYLLQRLTWDIQGRLRNDCFLPYLVPDLINYRVELYQENCLNLETILSHFFSIVAVSLPQKNGISSS